MGDQSVDDDQESTEQLQVGPLRVLLAGVEDLVPQYVNIVHVNNDRDVFQVVFGQATPPLVTGQEDLERLRQDGTIPGKVITRLVLTPRVFEELISVLQEQFRTYQESL